MEKMKTKTIKNSELIKKLLTKKQKKEIEEFVKKFVKEYSGALKVISNR
jgi:hypothetical protein